VEIDETTWEQEVGRLGSRSPARIAAQRERRRLEQEGVELSQLRDCDEAGADGTSLPGLYKVYVPIDSRPASSRPFAFVFSAARQQDRAFLRLVAFGERHPPQRTRSVYQRAHKRLHGRYPDQ